MRDESFNAFKCAIKGITPPPYGAVEHTNTSQRPILTVLDSFSFECFSPEENTIPVTPVDYAEAMDYYSPEMLIVESAWQGSAGSWTHQLVGSTGPKPAYFDMIKAARDRDIPVVFWNKEDPPHFEDFLPVAKEADLVLTTAGELVDKYKAETGHDHVGVLAFAAQPLIHHPFGRSDDESDVCFAGQYFAHKYPERRQQMEYLFPAAARHRFTIYSRELGNDPRYAFPPPYNRLISGSVPYHEMVKEYRRHKIFINVNSVVDSSTMCARRIFEISAAAGCVVSAPSRAISTFYAPDEVYTPEDEEEAVYVFDKLIAGDEFRARTALKAWRRTMKIHTYRHRMDEIRTMLGLRGVTSHYGQNLLIDGRGMLERDLVELLVDVDEDSQSFDRICVLSDFGVLSVSLKHHFEIVDTEGATKLLNEDLIVLSGNTKISTHALTDMTLAVTNYRQRGPMAKVAYNDGSTATYSVGVEFSPSLWGAPRGSLDHEEFRALLMGGSGKFDTLDRFNVIDTRRPVSVSLSGWEA